MTHLPDDKQMILKEMTYANTKHTLSRLNKIHPITGLYCVDRKSIVFGKVIAPFTQQNI